ncbi:Photosynthetic apparatus regulatory protein RegA [Botrimarina colliarenosi]|uniref:Photosynthetic apparatus regulatory protein RegA n=1 Tax=Botrimarina colliarenosi TaxID=2528001 RepID=A0A5C6A7S9_9BACT|nr:response regulator [Botrimarina colliarenosi]TWT95348.1 Photosynthetic apparatus regulatory protein RegA [Botrimarina colliarenosi]
MFNILLVDDDALVLKSVSRALNFIYYVATAYSVTEAETLLAGASPFRVVVTDIRMPGDDGFKLLERCGPKYPDTRFIVLSGCQDVATVRRIEASPYVFRFLQKPASVSDIATAMIDARRSLGLDEDPTPAFEVTGSISY